jgi:hypothetical protein
MDITNGRMIVHEIIGMLGEAFIAHFFGREILKIFNLQGAAWKKNIDVIELSEE